ncbi:MAG: hypothetical protein JW774_10635 [Candidatus Aureabacteria bacterium]|nr:hypothetical protein [Candidatus Auribacterota bacterium]
MFNLVLIVDLILFIFITRFSFSESFYLTNGQVLKGNIKEEQDNGYMVEIAGVGSIFLAKEKVVKIEKDEVSASPKDIFLDMRKKAKTKKECLDAAEYGFSHEMPWEALILLKRAWIIDGKKDTNLKERIQRIENQNIDELLNKAKSLSDSGQFRQAVSILNKILKNYPVNPRKEEIKALKQTYYKSILSEEESIEFLEKVMNLFPFYPIGVSTKKTDYSYQSQQQKEEITFDIFKVKEMKMDPVFSRILTSFYSLFQLKDYIEKYQFNKYAVQVIHLKAELDSKRADTKEFNKLCAENNKIYKGKSVCRQFNQVKANLDYQMGALFKRLRMEKEIWTQKGYEKILGEWLKGDEVKKAKGYLYYLGEWLDPKAPDFEKTRLALEERQEKIKTSSQIPPKPAVMPASQTVAEIKVEKSVTMEDEIMARTPKKLVEQVTDTIKEEAKTQMDQHLENMKKTTRVLATEIGKETEKVRGIPIPYGIAAILALAVFLFWFKKRR